MREREKVLYENMLPCELNIEMYTKQTVVKCVHEGDVKVEMASQSHCKKILDIVFNSNCEPPLGEIPCSPVVGLSFPCTKAQLGRHSRKK